MLLVKILYYSRFLLIKVFNFSVRVEILALSLRVSCCLYKNLLKLILSETIKTLNKIR